MIGIKVTKVARISRDVDRKNFVRLIKYHKKIAQTIMVIDAEKIWCGFIHEDFDLFTHSYD